jgi:GTP-binding protein LepA
LLWTGQLCNEKRGEFIDMKYLTESRTTLVFEMPLGEVVTDFFDEMKSRTRGYASMEYSLIGFVLCRSQPRDKLSGGLVGAR